MSMAKSPGDANWWHIKSAPKDGTIVLCLWPSYDAVVGLHQDLCLWKKDYYQLGNIMWEGWWILGGGLPAKDPLYWRHVAPPQS